VCDVLTDVCLNNNNNNELDTVAEAALPPVEVEEDGWNCSRCTFLNHPLLTVCELCSFERSESRE